MSAPEQQDLRAWIGRKKTHDDTVTAWPLAALAATFDRDDPAPRTGDVIPAGWHWLYFLETTPASELGSDGHTQRGGFLPPVELPRRMWAGGRIEFRRQLRVGDAIRRDSEVLSVEPKQGRSGRLVFVTVRHTVTTAAEIAVVEEHDIVYREAAKPGDPPPAAKPAPQEAIWRREIIADPVMLFRFSALIFNAHRIHYDLEFCRGENYPGVVVHGPLQTLLLLDLLRRHEPRAVRKLDYRAVNPVFHFEPFSVNGNPAPGDAVSELWTANAAGNYAMQATVCFV